jgi:hypothetical protein
MLAAVVRPDPVTRHAADAPKATATAQPARTTIIRSDPADPDSFERSAIASNQLDESRDI